MAWTSWMWWAREQYWRRLCGVIPQQISKHNMQIAHFICRFLKPHTVAMYLQSATYSFVIIRTGSEVSEIMFTQYHGYRASYCMYAIPSLNYNPRICECFIYTWTHNSLILHLKSDHIPYICYTFYMCSEHCRLNRVPFWELVQITHCHTTSSFNTILHGPLTQCYALMSNSVTYMYSQ